MSLGTGARRRGVAYLVAFVVSTTALAGVFAATVAVTVAGAESEDFVDGMAFVLAVLAISAVLTGGAVVHWRGRARGDVAVPARPIAPADAPNLVVFGWRAIGIAVLLLAVPVGAAIGLNALSDGAQQLLDTGTRVTGTVVDFADPAKGSWTIDVRYVAAGTSRTAEIVLDNHREFTSGQPVIVVYDPADPGHVRTLDDENSNQWLTGLCVISAIAALIAIAFCVRAAVTAFRGR